MPAKTALVTGASTGGIGYALCKELQRHGIHVFAALRNPAKAGDLAQLSDIDIIKLDVESSQSIKDAVKEVNDKTNGKLDILINNAGRGYIMPLLDSDIQQSKKIFDLNVWSVLEVTQAFAPLLFATKGVIVNNSSIAAQTLAPYQAVYNSSKAALTMMSECLRIEVEPFGVKVIASMTGAVDSGFHEHNEDIPLPAGSKYKPIEHHINDSRNGKRQPTSHPADRFARELVADIVGGKTGLVHHGGISGSVRLLQHLPQWIMDKASKEGRGLDDIRQYV